VEENNMKRWDLVLAVATVVAWLAALDWAAFYFQTIYVIGELIHWHFAFVDGLEAIVVGFGPLVLGATVVMFVWQRWDITTELAFTVARFATLAVAVLTLVFAVLVRGQLSTWWPWLLMALGSSCLILWLAALVAARYDAQRS
jgi:hypothetical protein